MDDLKKIYRLDHYYMKKECLQEEAILLESELNIEEMINLVGSILFYFEKVFVDDFDDDKLLLTKVITKSKKGKDIKKVNKKIIENTIPDFDRWNNECYNIIKFENQTIYQIDIFEARNKIHTDWCLNKENGPEEYLSNEMIQLILDFND